jgi:hypothetical protein
VFKAPNGLAATVEEYNRCCGYFNESFTRNKLPSRISHQTSKRSMQFQLSLAKALMEGDDTKESMVNIDQYILI